MTKHVRRLALPLALASLLAMVPAGAASAAPGVEWNGHTSERMDFRFRTVRRDGVLTVVAFRFIFDIVCTETGELFTAVLGASGFAIPVIDGDFRYDDVFLTESLHLSGHLDTTVATGAISWAVPALTPEEELQVCGSGPLEWKANREAPAATTADAPDLSIAITGGGRTMRIESAGVTRVTTTAPPTLSFFGKTRQDFPIGFDIVGRPGERYVQTLIFGDEILCPEMPDGLSLAGFWFAHGHLADLDHGVWGIDAVFLTAAFHVYGTIATDPARGTLRDVMPAFTEDEELQLCSSGDVAWKASRVSAASDDEGTTSVTRLTRTIG
jgi:hypothetical protein